MKRIHDSRLLVVALVVSIMFSLFSLAQEGELKDTHVLPSGFVMKFERIGGSTWQTFGVYDSFWIYPDGKVINKLGKTAEIPPDVVKQWLKTITPHINRDLPLPQRPPYDPRFAPRPSCPDCFEYLVTIYDKDRIGTPVPELNRRFDPLLDSDGRPNTVSEIVDWLQSLVWSPLMGAPVKAKGSLRGKTRPIKVVGNGQLSKLIRKVEPVYPEQAKSTQLSGKVVMLVTVDEEGVVADVEVVSGFPIFADSAVTAAKQWRYSPTLLNGEPVPVMATVTVNFSFTASGATVECTGGQVESGKNSSKQE
jgi:TonB family protein